ncbi:hypothetical protein H5410_057491 [Solanum commersonii]|uniref:DUF4283 domain-containing protein n=1 Tax=Solanum commersonii TaxID=4109 RepID=A0A9J5WPW0_SOLCO|nr:hypothetical protein H5410_057491 [Solanum commersonii]
MLLIKLLNPSLPKDISFANSLKQLAQQSHDSLRRDITMVEGIPQIKWTEEEVNRMNQIEELQFAVIGKFTHDWSDLEELRRIIPQQWMLKAVVGKPIQIDQATINKSRSSCARVEYQRRTLKMSGANTTSSKARRPLEDTQDYSMS